MPHFFSRGGASRKAKVMTSSRTSTGKPSILKTTSMGPRALLQEQKRVDILHRRTMAGLSKHAEVNTHMNIDEGWEDIAGPSSSSSADVVMVDDSIPGTVGDEHEQEVLIDAALCNVDMRYARYPRTDRRTRRERRARADANWSLVFSDMFAAFLRWRYPLSQFAEEAVSYVPGPSADTQDTPNTSSLTVTPPTVDISLSVGATHHLHNDSDPGDPSSGKDQASSTPPIAFAPTSSDAVIPTSSTVPVAQAASSPPAAAPVSSATAATPTSPAVLTPSSVPAPLVASNVCNEPNQTTRRSPKHPDDSTASPPRDATHDFFIQVVDIYTLDEIVEIKFDPPATNGAAALVQQGYIGATPINPSIAFSIKTLELFRRLRLRKPSFSMEAFARVLCDFYLVSYKRNFRTLLGDAFEVYLALQRELDRKLREALGRTTANWRVLNSCPACCYKLEGEPDLPRGRMIALDGNNSLKRLGRHGDRDVADRRVFNDSDYYLSQDFVDKYANEVKSRPVPTPTDDNQEDETTATDFVELGQAGEGDPTDGGEMKDFLKVCVKNWKSAASEDKKKMWAMFDETGVFASACKHGFLLWLADMVKSGELAKYPLAIISKVLEVLDDKPCAAYDIGCKFLETILASSLGELFEKKGASMVVPTFHGYSHNFACQMLFHPPRLVGTGIEDFETMERIFSSSNALASVTRHMSAYRRRLFIDQHFQQWDNDKYENLGLMLYNNYAQALEVIEVDGARVDEVINSGQATEAQLDAWEQEELNYIGGLGEEAPYDIHAMTYVEMLQDLRRIELEFKTSRDLFLGATPIDYSYVSPSELSDSVRADISRTQKLETKRRHLLEKFQSLTEQVTEMEVQMGIDRRWQPGDHQYDEMLKYSQEREYLRASDSLQKLVVQRLFELQKLNLSGTGYKMRAHLAKSIQTRCRAIRSAIGRYNKVAAALKRPTLEWDAVSEYSFLEEFGLLRETREDVLSKEWAQQAMRLTMQQHRRVKRAKEEIKSSNVEIRRLHTSIVDETEHMQKVLDRLRRSTSPLYLALQERWTLRQRVNTAILSRLNAIYELPGFTGIRTPGVRLGSTSMPRRTNISSSEKESEVAIGTSGEIEDDDAVDDDEVNERLICVSEFLGRLTT